MLNQARTLLLNLSYVQESDHIPPGYAAIQLPANLQRFYDILFPSNTSRFYKLFLVQSYLNLIEAAGMSYQLKLLDNRISYSLDNTDFFKISQVSNPVISNYNFPIFINGQLNSIANSDYHYDAYLISQVNSESSVTVFSMINNNYLINNITTLDPDSAIISLTFDGNLSNEVQVGITGLSFVISGNDFTSTSNKTWQFTAESPYTFSFPNTFNSIATLNPFKTLDGYNIDLTQFENIWTMHYSSIYKFAAFLVAYINVVNTL